MRVDGNPRLAEPIECPYLPERKFVQQYFFGIDLDRNEMGALLETGWRRFGTFFFRPQCPSCQACEPIRIRVNDFVPTDSQRRATKKNKDTEFRVVPLVFKEEYFSVYENHSRFRFGREADRRDFEESFFQGSAPAFLTEYRIDGRLAGLGFCDYAHDGLSSVYFVYHEDYATLSLGIWSVVRETQLARELGLSYYYLGYLVRENRSMRYKGQFGPHEIMDWETQQWKTEEPKTD